MTVIEAIRTWLRGYSGLNGRLDVNFLGEEADTYSIDSIPSEEVIKRYHDGSTRRQCLFVVASRKLYDQNIAQNIESLEFFEDLTAWVEAKARARELPEMGENRVAQKIVVTSTAYPLIVSEDGKARYQIQMRLEYYQKRSV